MITRRVLIVNIIGFSSLLSMLSACGANPFEVMMQGYPQCQTPGLYYDIQTKEVGTQYFRESNLTPFKVEDGFAYYALKASYFGLPVVGLILPASTWGVRAITFDAPLDKAQKQLERSLGSDFLPSAKSENGEVPELIADPKNPLQSVFVCNDPT